MASSKLRTSLFPLAYQGVEPQTPSEFTIQTRSPTVDDYSKWNVGDEWLDSPRQELWTLVRKLNNVSTWVKTAKESIDTLTGDTGGAISPDALNNIDILGGTNINTAGTANTITINLDANALAEQFHADLGIAFPLVGVLNILGGTNISTSGFLNSVTVNVDPNTIADTYTTDSGNAIPAGGVINIVGAGTISTSGAGNTVTIEDINPFPADVVNFKARLSSDQSNVTGDNTLYSIPYDSELWDVGGDFDSSTGVFTAPADGYYFFMGIILVGDGSAATRITSQTRLTISGLHADTNFQNGISPEFLVSSSNEYNFPWHAHSEMDLGDTATVQIAVGNAAKTCTIKSDPGANDARTWIAGFLLNYL